MSYLIFGFKNYFNIGGRVTRKQYWMFQLWFLAFVLGSVVLDALLDTGNMIGGVGLINFLISIVFFLPILGFSVRRLHDINRSGLWIFINLVPMIGMLVLLIFFCTEGDQGINKYGSPPISSIVQ